MNNHHIFTTLKQEVKLDSRRTCYSVTYQAGLKMVRKAGAQFRSEVENDTEPNHTGRIRAEGVRLIVSTIRFLRHLT